MSNNFSQSATILFLNKEERDSCIVMLAKSNSSTPRVNDPYEGFSSVGDRCLTVWHSGNTNTAKNSKLLETLELIFDSQPNLPCIGSHHLEGNAYCFDISTRGQTLSFNKFNMIMMNDEATLVQTYASWAEKIQNVFPPLKKSRMSIDLSTDYGQFLKHSFVESVNNLMNVHKLVSIVSSDQQMTSIFEMLEVCLQTISDKYYQIEPYLESLILNKKV